MRYEVKLTTQAIEQIQEIVQYISKILLVPETAQKWLDSLQFEIRKLDSIPSRYPLTAEEPWRTKGIRKMPFNNFLVYYLIDEDKNLSLIHILFFSTASTSLRSFLTSSIR